MRERDGGDREMEERGRDVGEGKRLVEGEIWTERKRRKNISATDHIQKHTKESSRYK